ncbi:outer membrane lipoprotein, Slp family [Geotalea daltonii FRC-32]|uniref:Outer membrane lipoprotein, Slp family n=1 Tax=Geotalea daltonii (strain DSM 22248 / JCM 15807 / FRC-32) TaxID=316067 RepID=B9LYZ2_GEODF|nr:Slp family lipoprotein [Geotalea daltonii]ACM18724.1 outer membrane lipoprotein, Slp family [Geotalea daltonii FRC-32]
MRLCLLLVLMMMSLSGCAGVFSDETLNRVEWDVPFSVLRVQPEQYEGRQFLLGGAIVAVRNGRHGGELEVAQLSTDDNGHIKDNPTSGGRFLARSGDFLDPAIFRRGMLVSLVGPVTGKEVRELAGRDYAYPVLEIREIHLWRPEERSREPRFHFGFGIGTFIH